jgi:hypothetical protein
MKLVALRIIKATLPLLFLSLTFGADAMPLKMKANSNGTARSGNLGVGDGGAPQGLPVPGTAWLMMVGAAGLILRKRGAKK